MRPELLDRIPPGQEIASVTADGAFDTRKCQDAIAARGAAAFGHSLGPVAFVPSLPPCKNAKPWKPDSAGAIARNDILRTSKRIGRTIWQRWSGYHRRSGAETKIRLASSCSDSACPHGTSTVRSPSSRSVSFAGSLEPMAFARSLLNGFTALGSPITEVAG